MWAQQQVAVILHVNEAASSLVLMHCDRMIVHVVSCTHEQHPLHARR